MELALSDHTNGSTHPIEKNSLPLTPVPLKASGEGLPYAPVDFPNSGDVWTWKVGNKVSPYGYYTHRFLIVPKRLSPSRKIWLGSKTATMQYIRSEFPDADVDAFFSSFTWEIKGEISSVKKGKKTPSKRATPSKKVKSKPKSASRVSQRISLKEVESASQSNKRTLKELEPESQPSRRTSTRTVKKSKRFIEDTTSSMDIQLPEGPSNNKSNGFHKTTSTQKTAASPIKTTAVQSDLEPIPQVSSSLADYLAEMTQEDFEFYLNSLDAILYNTVPRALNSGPIRPQADELAKAQIELSSLLSTGIKNLVNSDKLSRVMNLSSKLKFDPYLSPEEISTLTLIQEIPLVQEDFLEAKRLTSEATKFFSELEEKKASIEERKNEFIISKGTIAFLQAEEGSALSTIREIDEQMALLNSRRAVLAKVVKTNQEKIAELCLKQKQAFDSVPKIVNEVQLAKLETSMWELRQKDAAMKEEQILAKFAPLEGFSFLS